LRALSPQRTLDRGYAIAQRDDGSIVRSDEDAPHGTTLVLRLAEGSVAAVSEGPLRDPDHRRSPAGTASTAR
jgi:exodeoxyribonuclease VII large subunit